MNDPEVLPEVKAVFAHYEAALGASDVAVLDELFWGDARVVRYGIAKSLYGAAEILAFRQARPSVGPVCGLERVVITTFGRDVAIASTLFHPGGGAAPGKIGRQMQTWRRMAEGWRVVAAHVSSTEG